MDFGLDDILTIVIYLLPGFLALEVFRSVYPEKRRPQYSVIIWSVIHTFVVHVLLALYATLCNKPAFDFFTQKATSLDAFSVVVMLLAGLAWGGVLTVLNWLRWRIPFLTDPDSLAVWPWIAARASGEELWALVLTKSGQRYLGWIKRYTYDPDREDHDFLLRPAFSVDEALRPIHEYEGRGVYLNTRDIESIEFLPGR